MKRECVIEIELLNEDANRKRNCAHLNRIVLASLREKTNNLFVSHEMCQKRAKEREKGQLLVLFIIIRTGSDYHLS